MNTKNIVISTLMLFFIVLEILIALDYISKNTQFEERKTTIYSSFLKFQSEIGYGGLTDHFKNYLLNPDDNQYKLKALENHSQALLQINKIETLGKEALGKPILFEHTRAMLEVYGNRLALIPEKTGQETLFSEMDFSAEYDDIPVHAEIERLSNSIVVELNTKLTDILNTSLKLSFINLIAIILVMIILFRFFFREQQFLLDKSKSMNEELEIYKNESIRSQNVLLSMMDDVKIEKNQTSKLNIDLSKINKEMEQFIYTVSHDLKTPLVTIGGFVKKLSNQLANQVTEKQKYRFERVLKNVVHMEKLLIDLLDLSRIIQQKETMCMVNLETVIDDQLVVLESMTENCEVETIIEQPLHEIYSNQRLLAECILNLLSNALRYKSSTRPLIINIWTEQTSTNTIIYVKDNGVGIDKRYHELIFGIFERLSPDVSGTGVGLTIVKTIMNKQEGWVSVESELDVGSTFSLHFLNKNTN